MELVPATAFDTNETRGFEDFEVLTDGLARGREPVFHGEFRAQLEQRLFVALHQQVEQEPARLVRKSFVDIRHTATIGKQLLACQGVLSSSDSSAT